MDTLLLNADGLPLGLMPLSTRHWADVILAAIENTVDVIYVHDDWQVHSAKLTFDVPSVVMLREYVRVSKRVSFSRGNLLMRDNYTCQYCGGNFAHDHSKLTMEHVTPRTYGGKTTWTNIIAACSPCNSARGHSLTYKKPLTEPYRPDYWNLLGVVRKRDLVIPDSRWEEFLNWEGDIKINPKIRSK